MDRTKFIGPTPRLNNRLAHTHPSHTFLEGFELKSSMFMGDPLCKDLEMCFEHQALTIFDPFLLVKYVHSLALGRLIPNTSGIPFLSLT